LRGEWRIAGELYGADGVFPRLSLTDLHDAHYDGCLENAALVATDIAMRLEKSGNAKRGYEIRRAVRRCGALMVSESNTLTESYYGARMTAIATQYPAGRYRLQKDALYDEKLGYQNARRTLYADLMDQTGHPDEARSVRYDKSAAGIVHTLRAMRPEMKTDYYALNVHWLIAFLIIMNALWLIIIGVVIRLFGRTPRVRANLPLTPYAARGLYGCILVTLTAATLFVLYLPRDYCVSALAALLPLLAAILLRRMPRSDSLRALAVCIVGSMIAALVVWVFANHTAAVSPYGALEAEFSAMTLNEDLANAMPYVVCLLFGMGGQIIAILLAIAFAVKSRMARTPASVGIVCGFRRLQAPMVYVLIISWDISILVASHIEEPINARINRMLDHEARQSALIAHIPWPTREP